MSGEHSRVSASHHLRGIAVVLGGLGGAMACSATPATSGLPAPHVEVRPATSAPSAMASSAATASESALALASAAPSTSAPPRKPHGCSHTLPTEAPSPVTACAVVGEQVDVYGVIIHPEGEEPLMVDLQESSVVLHPAAQTDTPSAVEVKGVLSFRGEIRKLPSLRFAGPTALASGVLRTGKQSWFKQAQAVGTEAHGDLYFGPWKIAHLPVPCSSLRVTNDTMEEIKLLPQRGSRWQGKGGESLWLAMSPGGPTAAIQPTYAVSLQQLKKREGWALLEAKFSDGSLIRGWAEPSSIEPYNESGGGYGFGIGLCRSGISGRGLQPGEDYFGPAQVNDEATVFARPGHGPWGKLQKGATVTVAHPRDSDWVQVTGVPGIIEESGHLKHAFVPLRSVTLKR